MYDTTRGGAETPPAIPDFVLVEKCGAGASGTIYLGVDRDGIRRAVRVLRYDALTPERIAAEKAAVGRYRNLIHGERGLVDVLYTGETPEVLYYVMPLADELNARWCKYRPATLAARLGDGGFTREERCATLLAVADALRRMHERGLAHCDLKPENILYIDGGPVIADPGSCAPPDEIAGTGTPGYRPPRPCRGGEADLYAFGMIVYTLFSGYPPERYPDVPADWGGNLHAAVDRIVLKCCGGGAARYRDASELCADLPALTRPPKRRTGKVAALFAAAALALLLAGILLTARGVKTPHSRHRTAKTEPATNLFQLPSTPLVLKTAGFSAAMHGGK